MRYRDAGVAIVAGVLVVGEMSPEHKPFWFDSPHSHVEFPEGTSPGNASRISWDSGANVNTNTAAALFSYSSYPYVSIVGKK
jgi:hypothetical protein